MALPKIEKMIRPDTPHVGYPPYKHVSAHSTANPNSTAEDEARYMNRKDLNEGYFTHVVGNGRIIQTALTNRGCYDLGSIWNSETYAAVELIESHRTKEEFLRDYHIYVELLRTLAKENGLPLILDTGDTGIITHNYSTQYFGIYGGHTDPYPYLAKWGISKAQFKHDIEQGINAEKPNQGKTWHSDSKGWWVRDKNGYAPRGWHKMDGIWYYMDLNTGYMVTGWKLIKGAWYYFNKSGKMQTGWQKIGDYFYYLEPTNGNMLKGWVKINGVWYYTRPQKDGKFPEGSEVFGWLKLGNVWYYFKEDGKMIANADKVINGKKYHFDSSGKCLNP